MENMDQSIFSLGITQKMKDDFKTLGLWATISAIVSFINTAIGLYNNFVRANSGGFYLVIAFLSAAVAVTLNIFLLNFGRKIKAGITEDNQEQVNEALNDLMLYFKICGIVVIVSVVLAILFVLYVVAVTARF